MDYKDYIKAEYCDAYVQERDNLADRLIEAKYNLLFLNMVYERDVAYRNSNDSTERFEIRIILRRIYITVYARNQQTGLLEKRYVTIGKSLYGSYYQIK